MIHVPEVNRIINHPIFQSSVADGNNGAFLIRQSNGRDLWIIASDGMGWEHVSVHIFDGKRSLTPRWEEMCKIKDIFWDKEDVVIQYHPRESEYVNNHPNTLHLWRPIGIELPTPPTITVGVK
jgi:hypothetical protein